MSCAVGRRHGSDPALLWLWCRLVATAPIRQTPTLGTSICCGCSPEKTKKTKKKKKSLQGKTSVYAGPSLYHTHLTPRVVESFARISVHAELETVPGRTPVNISCYNNMYIFCLHLQHVKVPRPGIEPAPQHWILNC